MACQNDRHAELILGDSQRGDYGEEVRGRFRETYGFAMLESTGQLGETNAEYRKFRADLQIKPALTVPERNQIDQVHEKPVVERENRSMG